MNDVILPLSSLTPEQVEERKNYIGASDASRIMDGDWTSLFDEKKGLVEPKDLSKILAVQMGVYTEPFNIAWYQQETGRRVDSRGRFVTAANFPYLAANLDGMTTDEHGSSRVVEAKHLSPFMSIEDAIKKYYPQVQHQMFVTGCNTADLSCLFGNAKWDYYTIHKDHEYLNKYLDMVEQFWSAVESNVRPADPVLEKQKISIDDMRKMDMSASNNWKVLAKTWVETKEQAKAFKDSEAGLKSLVPEDVRTAYGAGVYINRAKNGALSIRPLTDKKLKEFSDD